jgi:hypothetical protein
VPCLPYRAAASVIVRLSFRPLRGFFQRGLIEQSIAERLVKAAIAAGLLWLAIWSVLS